MQTVKPNYIDLGLSPPKGPQLRTLVDKQLVADLASYGIAGLGLKFDWSNSCIEGHDSSYLNSDLENYSSILVFDEHDNLVADGWMEFIHEGDFFLVYWDYITIWQNGGKIFVKSEDGLPDHVWAQIPDSIKRNMKKNA
ncbi:hypothetical protein [Spirosoma jeollabukense]